MIVNKTPREIDQEQQIGEREISSLRRQVIMLGGLFLISMVLLIMQLVALNGRFPIKRYLYTANAAAVCTFSPISERGDVTDAAVLNFAVQTAVSVHTLDYINWRRTLDAVTITKFTPEAREAATNALRRSGVLSSIIDNTFVLKGVLSGPATITGQGPRSGVYSWDIEIPMTLAYTGGLNSDRSLNYRPESRTIRMTVQRAEFTADNPDGLLVSAQSSTQTIAPAGRASQQEPASPETGEPAQQ